VYKERKGEQEEDELITPDETLAMYKGGLAPEKLLILYSSILYQRLIAVSRSVIIFTFE
jgi:hypothetical protein